MGWDSYQFQKDDSHQVYDKEETIERLIAGSTEIFIKFDDATLLRFQMEVRFQYPSPNGVAEC